jgi:hypothetical protein
MDKICDSRDMECSSTRLTLKILSGSLEEGDLEESVNLFLDNTDPEDVVQVQFSTGKSGIGHAIILYVRYDDFSDE